MTVYDSVVSVLWSCSYHRDACSRFCTVSGSLCTWVANLEMYNECRLPELVANVCFPPVPVLEVEGTKETGGCLFRCSRAVCFQLATSCQPPGTWGGGVWSQAQLEERLKVPQRSPEPESSCSLLFPLLLLLLFIEFHRQKNGEITKFTAVSSRFFFWTIKLLQKKLCSNQERLHG